MAACGLLSICTPLPEFELEVLGAADTVDAEGAGA